MTSATRELAHAGDKSPPVLVVRDGAVAIITLNRPARRNALGLELRLAIARTFTELGADTSVRAIVVTGGDQVFAAGADLKLLVDRSSQEVEALDLPGLWRPVAECPKPIIAAVSGFALGAGCEFAMMCDIIVADPTARFGQPEAKVGVMPGAGGTQRLIRRVGSAVASLMLMTGEPIDGVRACQLGLVSELTATGEALARAREIAQMAAQLPPRALATMKRVLALGAELPLPAALALEHREFLSLFGTADQKEGMQAFLDKRSPRFFGA